jgi:hypothetical protein
MGFRTDLITGIGQYLDAQNVGKFPGPYTATDTAIVVASLPATPDKAVALTLYDVDNGPGTDMILGLQCRVRGPANNRTEDLNILDRLFDALDGVEHTVWGGVNIVRVWQQSGAELGPDGNNRMEHTANYYIQLTRTGTHRTD